MRKAIIGAAACMVAALCLAPSALAVDEVNTKKLRKGLTTGGILEHMRTFQRLANANAGNRAATTPGYDASLAYAERRLKRAGLQGHAQGVPVRALGEARPGDAAARGPARPTPRAPPRRRGDYLVAEFSGAGNGHRAARDHERHRPRARG